MDENERMRLYYLAVLTQHVGHSMFYRQIVGCFFKVIGVNYSKKHKVHFKQEPKDARLAAEQAEYLMEDLVNDLL